MLLALGAANIAGSIDAIYDASKKAPLTREGGLTN